MIRRLLWMLWLLCLVLPCLAQTSAPDFILGADDVIEIAVRNHSELNKTLTILSDGTIAFGEIGEFKAAGKTPRALAQDIQAELEKTRNKVAVIISVKEVHSKRVRILGAVKMPGAFDLKRGWHLMDIVAVAGGLTAKPARISGRIIHSDNKVVTLDIASAVAKPDSDSNTVLQVDDLIMLDEQDAVKQTVNVLGQVGKPGAYELTDTTTLISLVAETGGFTANASLGKAYILRGATQIPMSLTKTLVKGEPDPVVTGFQLKPGDVLFIPESEQRIAILGSVARPGYYAIADRDKVTLMDALGIAGGQSADADTRKAFIAHPLDNRPPTPANIQDLLKKGKGKDIVLRAGDVLYVPPRGQNRGTSILDLLNPIAYFYNIFGR